MFHYYHKIVFEITNNVEEIKMKHFTGEIINGRKSMIETDLQSDGKYSLYMIEKKYDTENIGLQNYFLLTSHNVKSLLKIIAHLKYCRGMNIVEKKNYVIFRSIFVVLVMRIVKLFNIGPKTAPKFCLVIFSL